MFGGLLDFFKGMPDQMSQGMDYFGNSIQGGLEQMQNSAQGLPTPQGNQFSGMSSQQLPGGLQDLPFTGGQSANPLMTPDIANPGKMMPNPTGSLNPQMSPNFNGNPVGQVQTAQNSSAMTDPAYQGRAVDWGKLSQSLGKVAQPQTPSAPAPSMPRAQMASGGGIPAPQAALQAQMMGFGRQMPPWMQMMNR